MRIAQLTDPHIVHDGELLHGYIDSGKRLRDAFSVIDNMKPRVDVILLTGDLVEQPDDAAYIALQDILSERQSPIFLIPGNHDDRLLMHAKFSATGMYPCAKDCAQYDLNDYAVRLIALDSVWQGNELPVFDEDRADWLADALRKEPNKPTLLFIHHPPFHTGIAFVDLAPSDWYRHLSRVISQHDQVKLVLCGHAHTTMSGQIAGVPVYVAPSSAFQLSGYLGVDEAPTLIDEAGPVTIHYWTGNQFVTSPYLPVQDAGQTRLDRIAGVSWDELKEAMKGDLA